MRVTFLGTGTSQGVPMIACDCAVCTSPDPRNKRLRPSIYVEADDGACFVVDTTPDFRTQCLVHNIRKVDAVVITHTHADHILGLDDLRIFNALKEIPPPVEEQIRGVPLLILDALRHRPHPSHMNVKEALAGVERIRPGRTFFTHLTHELEHTKTNGQLPEGVRLAYDGLRLQLDGKRLAGI
jgi:phosphoribosyl 1,2-cyclic phosphodiesterase